MFEQARVENERIFRATDRLGLLSAYSVWAGPKNDTIETRSLMKDMLIVFSMDIFAKDQESPLPRLFRQIYSTPDHDRVQAGVASLAERVLCPFEPEKILLFQFSLASMIAITLRLLERVSPVPTNKSLVNAISCEAAEAPVHDQINAVRELLGMPPFQPQPGPLGL